MVEQKLPVLVIDGATFDDFKGFQRGFSALLDDYEWRGNLDAFNDILRGGFGTPEGSFVLRWLASERSRDALGHSETVKRLRWLLEICHPSHHDDIRQRINLATRCEGETLFDEVVEIIRTHGPGGYEAEDGVVLDLR